MDEKIGCLQASAAEIRADELLKLLIEYQPHFLETITKGSSSQNPHTFTAGAIAGFRYQLIQELMAPIRTGEAKVKKR